MFSSGDNYDEAISFVAVYDQRVVIEELNNGKRKEVRRTHVEGRGITAFAIVSETFAVGCNDGVVRCLDSSTLKEVCKAVYIFLNSLLLICNSVDEGEIGYN